MPRRTNTLRIASKNGTDEAIGWWSILAIVLVRAAYPIAAIIAVLWGSGHDITVHMPYP